MLTAISRQTGWLYFRACVALRQILAARKKPKTPRVRNGRKAAMAAGLWLAATAAQAGEARRVIAKTPPAPASATALDDDRIRPMHDLGTSIAPPIGEQPANVAQLRLSGAPEVAAATLAGRGWIEYVSFWEAPALCYRPLYFEEVNLERYGHSAGHLVQPVVSGAHFIAAVGKLPVAMALKRPWESTYALGYGRPGSDAPWERR